MIWHDSDLRDLLELAVRGLDDDDAADARNIAQRIDAAIERDQEKLDQQSDELARRNTEIKQLTAVAAAARKLLHTLDDRSRDGWDRFHDAADVRTALRDAGEWS